MILYTLCFAAIQLHPLALFGDRFQCVEFAFTANVHMNRVRDALAGHEYSAVVLACVCDWHLHKRLWHWRRWRWQRRTGGIQERSEERHALFLRSGFRSALERALVLDLTRRAFGETEVGLDAAPRGLLRFSVCFFGDGLRFSSHEDKRGFCVLRWLWLHELLRRRLSSRTRVVGHCVC